MSIALCRTPDLRRALSSKEVPVRKDTDAGEVEENDMNTIPKSVHFHRKLEHHFGTEEESIFCEEAVPRELFAETPRSKALDLMQSIPLGKEPLRVFLRLRPNEDARSECVRVIDEQHVSVHAPEGSAAFQNGTANGDGYTFHRVFSQEVDQESVFRSIALPFVDDLFRGHSALLFAYGVTNAGKTYTILGESRNLGILPRALQRIMSFIQHHNQRSDDSCVGYEDDILSDMSVDHYYGISVSNFEIYMESVYDLLQDRIAPNGQRQELRMNDDGQGNVIISDLSSEFVETLEHANEVINLGIEKRRTGVTASNALSSRSHSVFTIRLMRWLRDDPQGRANAEFLSRFDIVDLAGSERTAKTKTDGKRLQEAVRINQSLVVLGRCLETLRTNQVFKRKKPIPFRESKLTRLFQKPFTEGGHIAMVINVNPCRQDFDETCNALRYSAIARKIVTTSKVDTWRSTEGQMTPGGSSNTLSELYDYIEELLDETQLLRDKALEAEIRCSEIETDMREECAVHIEARSREMQKFFMDLLEKQRTEYEKRITNEFNLENINPKQEGVTKLQGMTKAEKSGLLHRISTLEDYAQQLRNHAEKRQSTLKERVKQLEDALRVLDVEYSGTQKELHDLKKNYQIEMIGHKDALTKIADLQRAAQEQIQVRDGDMQDMESEITRLRDELEFAVEQNTQLRQSLSSSEENVSKKSEEIDRLVRALESKSAEYKNAEVNILSVHSKLREAETAQRTLQERVSTVERLLQLECERSTRLSSEKAELLNQSRSHQKRCEKLEKQANDAMDAVGESETARMETQEKVLLLEEEVKRLTTLLQSQSAFAAEENCRNRRSPKSRSSLGKRLFSQDDSDCPASIDANSFHSVESSESEDSKIVETVDEYRRLDDDVKEPSPKQAHRSETPRKLTLPEEYVVCSSPFPLTSSSASKKMSTSGRIPLGFIPAVDHDTPIVITKDSVTTVLSHSVDPVFSPPQPARSSTFSKRVRRAAKQRYDQQQHVVSTSDPSSIELSNLVKESKFAESKPGKSSSATNHVPTMRENRPHPHVVLITEDEYTPAQKPVTGKDLMESSAASSIDAEDEVPSEKPKRATSSRRRLPNINVDESKAPITRRLRSSARH